MDFCKGSFGLLLLFVLLSCQTRRSPVQPTAASEEETMARRTHDLVNAHRSALRLPPLVWNKVIADQAVLHSRKMADGKVPFGHDGFDLRFQAVSALINAQAGAENVAYNYGSDDAAQTAVNSWLNSPGHRANIEGEFTLTGVGCAKDTKGGWYFTQIFMLTSQPVALTR